PAPGEVPSCAEAGVIGSLCGIAGSMMATEAVKLITGMGQVLLGRIAVIDALTMRIHEIPLHTGRSDAETRSNLEETDSSAGAGPPDLITTLDLHGLQQRRDRSDKTATVLLDVREPDEAGHDGLPG